MKKTYEAPAVITNGGVVRETLSTGSTASEAPNFKSLGTNSIGFYL